MKRTISILLVIVLLLSMLPTAALAGYTENYRGNALMAVNTKTSTSLSSASVALGDVELEQDYTIDPALEAVMAEGYTPFAVTEDGIQVEANLPELVPADPNEAEPAGILTDAVMLDEPTEDPVAEEVPEPTEEEWAAAEQFVLDADEFLAPEPAESEAVSLEEDPGYAEPVEEELIAEITEETDTAWEYTQNILEDTGAPLEDEAYTGDMDAPLEYTTSNARYFTEYQSNGTMKRHTMQCVYVGKYCTVWSDYSGYSAVRLSTANAKAIGQTFDNKFTQMLNTFGSYWWDADGDKKIALMCYDIDNTYYYGSSGSYVGGYFWVADMVNSSGYVNGVYYGSNNHVQSNFSSGVDCLSIDTYPGMGSGTPFSNVSDCYSTLFHELQHLLNFSYQVKNGSSGYFDAMETYLNEAFSMGAEHLITGSSSVSGRVNYFNSSSYVQGSSLTYWYSNGGYSSNYVLSNYANSYLFGQYIRARYEMLYPGQGSTIYKQILTRRNAGNKANTLGIIASLLKTNKADLITDFWQAVYMKMDRGIYGFNGESWADSISPRIQSSLYSSNAAVHCGGVKYYNPGSYGVDVQTQQGNIRLRTLFSGNSTGPGVKSITFTRTGPQTAKLTIVPTQSCTIHYNANYGYLTSKSSLTNTASLTAGQAYTFNYKTTSGLRTGTCPNFYYYLSNSSGSSAMLHLIFPMWTGNFKDVSASAWYADAVQFVTHYGIMNGTSATSFGPNGSATRGMLVTMLYRMDGEPSVSGYRNPFRDVASNQYYYNAVLWASRNGIVNGTSAKTFSPNALITREQTVTMMYRYADFKDYSTSAYTSLSKFYDDYKVSSWATSAMRWAVAEGVITGNSVNGRPYLQPQGTTTRAQMAAIFQRFCLNIAQ